MENYRIEPGPSGFRVVEVFADGGDGHALCGFPTEAYARSWVQSYLGADKVPNRNEPMVIPLTVF